MSSNDLRQFEISRPVDRHVRARDVRVPNASLRRRDGPVQNNCPGEAITPAELFLSGVGACGIELLQVIAKDRNVPLATARVTINGTIDRSKPVRPDVSLFNSVRIKFVLTGVTRSQGAEHRRGLPGPLPSLRHGQGRNSRRASRDRDPVLTQA